MEPAIRIAEDGYEITPFQHRQARWVAAKLSGAATELFLRSGSPPPVGYLFRQPALATTLRRLARSGSEDFYTGAIARLIADDMRAHGGLVTEQDLAGCVSLVEREPISASYRKHRIFTVRPPGGGVQLLLALQILERLNLTGSPDFAWYESIALATSAVIEPGGFGSAFVRLCANRRPRSPTRGRDYRPNRRPMAWAKRCGGTRRYHAPFRVRPAGQYRLVDAIHPIDVRGQGRPSETRLPL
jgi:hypothetical protein